MQEEVKPERGMFVGHRTYAPRESWFFKGMEAVARAMQTGTKSNPFRLPDAAERFGIGHSMVAAARFWLQVTGLMVEWTEEAQRMAALTPFGKLVWTHDPYLEHAATLCWMHYHVICNPLLAPSWYWLYNHGPQLFTVSECLSSLWQWTVSRFAQQEIRQEALQRDIACLLRMYLPRPRVTPEDLTLSPFSRLHLILQVGEAQQGRYQRVPPKELHPLVPLALLADQQSRTGSGHVLLHDALYQPRSVGRCLNLSATSLLDLLAQVPQRHPSWQVQVAHTADHGDLFTLPTATFLDVVQSYYHRETGISD